MRFFHLSDLHLGIKLYEHDLLKDQKAILDEIVALTRQYQPDAVVFAGDIYDRSVPPVDNAVLAEAFLFLLRTIAEVDEFCKIGRASCRERVSSPV